MKSILIIILAIASLILEPFCGWGEMIPITSNDPPPVAQPLVREGDFSIGLVKALNLGTPQDEADAENTLISHSIAPKNGWISDYPVTPDILGELQNAVIDAASAGQIPMQKDDALKSLQTLADGFGLQIVVDTNADSSQDSNPPESYEGENPDVINNYYYDNGPPVITYYPPPYEYDYLYAWVPYPFWYDGFFFTGYFCLHDFDRIIVGNREHQFITNHWSDHHSRRVFLVNPRTRGIDRHIRAEGGFDSRHARTGAETIYKRSYDHRYRGDNHGMEGRYDHFDTRHESRNEFHAGASSDSRHYNHWQGNAEHHPMRYNNSIRADSGHDSGNRWNNDNDTDTDHSGSYGRSYGNSGFSHGQSSGGWHGGGHFGGFHGGGFGHRR